MFMSSKKIGILGGSGFIGTSLTSRLDAKKSDFNQTLSILKELAKDSKLVIKRHPRSDNSLYEECGLEITDTLPDAKVFIGHYSSLLATPIKQGKIVITIPLKNHVIPDYFRQSSYSANSVKEIKAIMNEKPKEFFINHFFSDPIGKEKVSNLILSKIL